jgi:putative heme-binding domain-containing protein
MFLCADCHPRRAPRLRRLIAPLVLALSLTAPGTDPAPAAEPGRQPEPWADARLTMTRGLTLWLDAGRQGPARTAHDKPALTAGGPVDVWYDASGNGLHLVQRSRPAMPRFVPAGDRAVVRFDGQAACLGLTGLNRDLGDFTAFLVAAPRSNPGDFRALLAVNETGKNDYTTGFTIDQSGPGSGRFDQLNVEGRGFQGVVNLMRSAHPFGEFHVVEARGQAGRGGVSLLLDGTPAGGRNRAPGRLRMDNLTLGARFYSNTADPPSLRGFLDGDVAEVLLYDRALGDDESRAVTAYLRTKYAGLEGALAAAAARDGVALRSVAHPPPVQMFVPGSTVRELPVRLTNINNVRYRADGKLVALAYDGNVYLLSDTDGDGLEDNAELFWENNGRLRAPIGMALTPPGYRLGDGLFVASKGKLSLIVDTHHRGRADREIIVADGWQEIPHGVDALGVALDRDGGVYFGLGTQDYTNAYLLDRDGKAHYDLHSERGTILHVSPDFGKRTVVCTGIRFPVGLAFNREGDLFATDQEGATWLPNGNPLDELLHIQPGRHYGFPPRHPRHLPGVIDEPSVFDYGPQHQSTCGLAFDEPVNGGPVFGPAGWQGDALIAGYSRGKLYRTELVKTPAGYVARNHLLACLNMLAVDVCVSPRGDLVVAAHGGLPDWGSGPGGQGKLYKIHFTDRQCPQPVFTWAAGPREVRVAFDRPLDPAWLRDLARHVTIDYGRYVRPGDRFESLRPGYEAVSRQLATPRYNLPVLAVQVTGDRRTLVLATAPQSEAVSYAITLPGLGRTGPLQVPAIDLGYDLCGVSAAWQARGGPARGDGWLPHPDLTVARAFTRGSADHEAFWQQVRQPGRLTLRCRLDLWQMLRPAVQPGSTLDYRLPPEHVTLVFRSPEEIAVRTPAGTPGSTREAGGRKEVRVQVDPKEGEPLPLEIELTTGERPPTLDVAYFTNEDSRPRPLPLGRVLLPWAPVARLSEEALARREVPELRGGNWLRGRQVFFSDQAQCGRCHRVAGQGGRIGPDLSNLVQRDYASVLRDILQPSAAINPDYLTYTAELTDGRTLTGVVRTEGDRLIVGDTSGKETAVSRAQVESLTPSKVSTMPEGLDKALGPDRLRDLLTFLLTEPLQPAPPERAGAPPPRRRSEVEAVLRALPASNGNHRTLNVVLAAGPKDHGPGEHDYPLWQRRWRTLLELDENAHVSTADGWPTAGQWAKADLVVMYSANPGWSKEKALELDAYLARGGGLVLIHYAVNGRGAADAFAERIGLAWKDGASRFRHGPQELTFPDRKDPIARGLERLKLEDESYWRLDGDVKKVHVLATGQEEGQAQPLLWTREQGKGRVFACIPGHYTWTFDDPLFRVLLLRGMAWAAGEPVDRFQPLVFPGARVQED